jgi:hypothetical protein
MKNFRLRDVHTGPIEGIRGVGKDEHCPELSRLRGHCLNRHSPAVPQPWSIGDGDIGTAAEVGSRSVSDASDRRATSSRNDRQVPKTEPRIARNAPGLLMSRRGAGGVVSATLMHIIASP